MAKYVFVAACLCLAVPGASLDATQSQTKRLIRSKVSTARAIEIDAKAELVSDNSAQRLVRSARSQSSMEVDADGRVVTVGESSAVFDGDKERQEKNTPSHGGEALFDEETAPASFTKTVTVGSLKTLIASWASTNSITDYSVLAGDEDGTRFVDSVGSKTGLDQPQLPTKPTSVASVGKWAAAAALGRAVKLGTIKWDDTVNKYIDWWTKDPSDGRSKVTFRHLMSQTSGLIEDTTFAHALGLQDVIAHADIGWRNTKIVLETSCRKIFDNTPATINPGEAFRYGETHFLVAELAAIKAAGSSRGRWRAFFYQHWGKHLKLKKAKILKNGDWNRQKRYFGGKRGCRGCGDSDLSYGFWEAERIKGYVANPDAGAQLIVSPCAYARFMIEMASRGEAEYGSDTELDVVQVNTGAGYAAMGNYALGHWVREDMSPPVHHSIGAFGGVPIMSTLTNGKKYWVYLNLAEDLASGTGKALAFIQNVVPSFHELLSSSSKPAVTTGGCTPGFK